MSRHDCFKTKEPKQMEVIVPYGVSCSPRRLRWAQLAGSAKELRLRGNTCQNWGREGGSKVFVLGFPFNQLQKFGTNKTHPCRMVE